MCEKERECMHECVNMCASRLHTHTRTHSNQRSEEEHSLPAPDVETGEGQILHYLDSKATH